MISTVYLIIGVSGSGKSWVSRQLKEKFLYLPHDRCWEHYSAKPDEGDDPKWGPPGCKSTHLSQILSKAKDSDKPLITEVPFGERQLKEDLEGRGIKVVPIFIIEDPEIVARRYQNREGKPLPKNVYTRASTIIDRAKEWNAFFGTSSQVLEHLKNVKLRMSPSEWRDFNRK